MRGKSKEKSINFADKGLGDFATALSALKF
jgi:hypothetical protein